MTVYFNNVYINDYITMISSLDRDVTVKNDVDILVDDFYYKSKKITSAEAMYQKEVVNKLLSKNNLSYKKIDLLVGGDLENQLSATNKTASILKIPFLGTYSACATFVESLIIGAVFLSSKKINNTIVVSSSHNLVCERQFRYPIEYGSKKSKTNTFTLTGAASSLLTNKKSRVKIESATIGKVVDIGYKNVNNIGAVMASSCAETLYSHFEETNRKYNYYDLILTGDLGKYGINIMLEYLNKKYSVKLKKVKDAGSNIYNLKKYNDIAGASGPICLPIYLFSKVLKNKKYKKILIVGTGSLHSSDTSKLKESIPSVSHAISLEVIE